MKKGYKQTEIGIIPEDWEVKKLDIFGVADNNDIAPIIVIADRQGCLSYPVKNERYTTHLALFKEHGRTGIPACLQKRQSI